MSNVRIFTEKGVEISQDGIPYIKNKGKYFCSKGEDFNENSQFSEYKILEVLGKGGFGLVKLGKHKITKELVAIKYIDATKFSKASNISKIHTENEVLSKLDHKNIIKVYNCYDITETT